VDGCEEGVLVVGGGSLESGFDEFGAVRLVVRRVAAIRCASN
jgi:hypothetical protein